jgi:cyclopropane fatty-acyl-phospholipid synthase-like methyltransferase
MLRLTFSPLLLLVFLPLPGGSGSRGSVAQNLAPYIATPEDVVERMLTLAEVTRQDVVYDLGCGDGRIPIAAAKKYGARGVGVDIDPKLVAQARANAKAEGVEALVEFRVENAMTTDVSAATVVTLFLLSSSNEKLKPMLTRQLKPGARIVSHAFSMGREWPADKVDQFVSARGDEVTLYLWRMR